MLKKIIFFVCLLIPCSYCINAIAQKNTEATKIEKIKNWCRENAKYGFGLCFCALYAYSLYKIKNYYEDITPLKLFLAAFPGCIVFSIAFIQKVSKPIEIIGDKIIESIYYFPDYKTTSSTFI